MCGDAKSSQLTPEIDSYLAITGDVYCPTGPRYGSGRAADSILFLVRAESGGKCSLCSLFAAVWLALRMHPEDSGSAASVPDACPASGDCGASGDDGSARFERLDRTPTTGSGLARHGAYSFEDNRSFHNTSSSAIRSKSFGRPAARFSLMSVSRSTNLHSRSNN